MFLVLRSWQCNFYSGILISGRWMLLQVHVESCEQHRDHCSQSRLLCKARKATSWASWSRGPTDPCAGARWAKLTPKGQPAARQMSHWSQGRLQVETGVWLGHTLYLCWGQQMELKHCSEVKQGDLQRGFSQLLLTHQLFTAMSSKLVQLYHISAGFQHRQSGLCWGCALKDPHTLDLMVFLWSLTSCL